MGFMPVTDYICYATRIESAVASVHLLLCKSQHSYMCARLVELLAVLPCCCCWLQEPESISAWQRKFGFRQVKQQQLRQLMADVPPLNYYEDSVLLSKKLPKQQPHQSSQQLQQPQQTSQQSPAVEQAAAKS